ncbi:alpha-amylase family glycosyl hydrolase [Nostoc parmelioides]|uniref:Glycosyl hydrolase family 13 catalytic domain-containing protein n=1 Tax=Nostoc parmelioides FACHB-3921 TaxID=2692909 RepID=A0ABR8B9L9_9NOSO|nr:alpha-amylase family glycosyl hydrolase [Nostoc parmelioides]MBD2250655.1 hypothetical protein [Nostoc parmelioides FACHB-3921]
MLNSIYAREVYDIFHQAKCNALNKATKSVQVGDEVKEIPSPFPSPADWRDLWIYFIMIDRFNNPSAPPKMSWNAFDGDRFLGREGVVFQGGTFEGIRQQLGYLEKLGVGAIWITPPFKNCQYKDTYHGYGIQDFLQIDPRFASNKDNPEAELQALIDEAHARGIYVIFDIVLNHVGNVFSYFINDKIYDESKEGKGAGFVEQPYPIRWHNTDGTANLEWENAPTEADHDAAVWPRELCKNDFFRRRGTKDDTEQGGDFSDLRELVTDIPEVRNILIRIHQYLIAKFDIDGFRIDTLRFIEPEFARIFGNSMHEFALSIGKKNFFSFGEIWAAPNNTEEKISRFIGRKATEPGDLLGVDAALDFPLFFKLPDVLKGSIPPQALADVYEKRKENLRGIISSHGDVSKFLVTFLDNHDLKSRFYYSDSANSHRFDDQVTLAITCLFALQGIPCIYYGTEQGLNGAVGDIPFGDLVVRQALWGKPGGGFKQDHSFYKTIAKLSEHRKSHPALRYGRQYFRPVSGDGKDYGVSPYPSGVLAFSRILNETEVVLVANTNTELTQSVYVIVDYNLHAEDPTFKILFSNKSRDNSIEPEKVEEHHGVNITEVNGKKNYWPVRVMKVTLQPMEVQILVK